MIKIKPDAYVSLGELNCITYCSNYIGIMYNVN